MRRRRDARRERAKYLLRMRRRRDAMEFLCARIVNKLFVHLNVLSSYAFVCA